MLFDAFYIFSITFPNLGRAIFKLSSLADLIVDVKFQEML